MVAVVVAMLIILAVAGVVAGIVVVGIEGRGKSRVPKIAHRLATTARHFNGDGDVPKMLSKVLN